MNETLGILTIFFLSNIWITEVVKMGRFERWVSIPPTTGRLMVWLVRCSINYSEPTAVSLYYMYICCSVHANVSHVNFAPKNYLPPFKSRSTLLLINSVQSQHLCGGGEKQSKICTLVKENCRHNNKHPVRISNTQDRKIAGKAGKRGGKRL